MEFLFAVADQTMSIIENVQFSAREGLFSFNGCIVVEDTMDLQTYRRDRISFVN